MGSSVFYDPLGVYPFNRDELAAMGVILIAVVVLGAIFRFTSIGLSMRAVVESPRMTELNGIAADRVSAVAWALSSTFAGMAGVLIAPIRFQHPYLQRLLQCCCRRDRSRGNRSTRQHSPSVGRGNRARLVHCHLQYLPAPLGRRPHLATAAARQLLELSTVCRVVRDIGLLACHKEVT